jgi:hypothetical protein
MDSHFPTNVVPATAEYVLAVLQDEHRQMCAMDDADASVQLTFDTTVAEWRDAILDDMSMWWEVGRALNAWWGIQCSHAEWRKVLRPARKKRLGDVCNLIAQHASRHIIRPAGLLGQNCREAGAFLTIRSLLIDDGAKVAEIMPSSLLAPIARQHLGLFLGPISRLAPGALPAVKVHSPTHDAAFWLLIAALPALVVGGISNNPFATIAGVLSIVLAYVLAFATRMKFPRAVEFGTLRTFRDLARVLVRARDNKPN